MYRKPNETNKTPRHVATTRGCHRHHLNHQSAPVPSSIDGLSRAMPSWWLNHGENGGSGTLQMVPKKSSTPVLHRMILGFLSPRCLANRIFLGSIEECPSLNGGFIHIVLREMFGAPASAMSCPPPKNAKHICLQ